MERVKILKFRRTQECQIIIEKQIGDTEMFEASIAWSGSMAHMNASVNEEGNLSFSVSDGSYLNPTLKNVQLNNIKSINGYGFQTTMEAVSYINSISFGYIDGLS